jgi:hypothetical protein
LSIVIRRIFETVPRFGERDPNGVSLEYCCVVGNRPEGDAMMHGALTLPRAALELHNATATEIGKAKSIHGNYQP